MVEENALTDPEGNCKRTFYCSFSSIHLDIFSNIAYETSYESVPKESILSQADNKRHDFISELSFNRELSFK